MGILERKFFLSKLKSASALIFATAVFVAIIRLTNFAEHWDGFFERHGHDLLDDEILFALIGFFFFGTLLFFFQNLRLIEANFDLEQEKAFSENVLSETPNIIIGMDQEGIIVFTNPAAERMTEYGQGELKGKDFWQTLLKVEVTGALRKYLESGADVDRAIIDEGVHEECLTTRSGRKLLISFSILHRPLDNKDITVLIGKDVSKERQNLEQQASYQKMQALAEMSGGLAHEINNALQPVLGLSEVVREMVRGKDERVEECVDIIHRNALNARKIVAGVLAFGRKNDGTERNIHLAAETISEAAWFAGQLLPSTVKVERNGFDLDDPEESYKINVNKVNLIQIMTNLFSNASYAMKERGILKVNYAQREITGAEAATLRLKPGKFIMIEVVDEGCGMDEATARSAFEPFFTTKKVGEGTGLGLSIVYGLIREWKGDAVLESASGVGTTVRIFLPHAGMREDRA